MNLMRSASKKPTSMNIERFDMFELPLEIQENIFLRLPVKSILACKAISKAYNNFISTDYFTRIHHQNSLSTNSFTVFAQIADDTPSLNLIELKNQKLIYQDTCIGPNRLPDDNDPCRHFSSWGHCNGLVCVLKLDESDEYNLYVTNPIYRDFIKLPHAYIEPEEEECHLAYGLGYCQRTNRYKVLRIITTHKTYERLDDKLVSKAEIFTVGFDKSWRPVVAKNVPYNMQRIGDQSANPQTLMVSVGSYLHWLVGPVHITRGTEGTIEPGKSFICAFNMTTEKFGQLAFPQGFDVEFYDNCIGDLNCDLEVVSNKLCLVENIESVINIWVMDEYGVAGSWRKHFMLPNDYSHPKTVPLSVGRILISHGDKLVFYDMEANKSLMDADLMEEMCYMFLPNIFAFDLSFVSLRNMISGGAILCPKVPVVTPPRSLKYTKYKYI